MASRYNSVYFFQHSLMNLPFVNINDIIHPNAENIPYSLLHFASAMYHNSQYWKDMHKVRQDMELESHYNDYIESYISYLSMMQTIYSLFTEGITHFFHASAINTIWPIVTDTNVIKSWYCLIYRLHKFCILLSLQYHYFPLCS